MSGAPGWVGWLRERGGRWRRVCAAETYDKCWSLLVAARPKTDSCEKIVNRGEHPEHRKKPR